RTVTAKRAPANCRRKEASVANMPSTTGVTKQPPPQAVILEMWSGYVVSRALYVVAELAIADHLVDRPKTAAEVAAATRADEEALHRVLQMLTSRRGCA